MPFSAEGTVAVITGASSGIGRATALEFARRGATVVLAARRREALEALALECEDAGGHALAVGVDVREAEDVEALARHVVETLGRIDVWINNAAVTLFGRLEEVPMPAFRRVVDTNLLGYVHGARAVLPWFREQGRGVLVNVSSVVGRIGQPFTSAYVISKFGIIGLSDALRQELVDAPDIHVVTVLPGSTDTPLFQQGANYMGRVARPIPPVRDPREVARAILSAVRSPRREVVPGANHRAELLLKSLAPGLVDRFAPRVVERRHFEDRAAEPTSGNLFEPMPEFAKVDGGWRKPSPRPSAGPRLLLAALAGLGVGLALSNKPKRKRGNDGDRLPQPLV